MIIMQVYGILVFNSIFCTLFNFILFYFPFHSPVFILFCSILFQFRSIGFYSVKLLSIRIFSVLYFFYPFSLLPTYLFFICLFVYIYRFVVVYISTYGGWKKSRTSRQVVCPMIYRVSTIQGDAGFLPSTVCKPFRHSNFCG